MINPNIGNMKQTEPFHPSLILCPVDFSELSDLALKYGAAGARAFEAALVIFHAQRFLLPPYFTSSQVAELTRQRRGERARATEFLRLYAKKILGSAAEGLRIKYDLEDAHPVDAILDAVRRHRAELLVMGTHGRGGAKRLWLGSVLENVIRQAGVPVFAVRQKQHEFIDAANPQKTPELKTILCPVSGSKVGRIGLEKAAALARQFNSRLVAVCIAEPDQDGVSPQKQEELASWLRRIEGADCALEIRRGRGEPGKQIVDLASKLKTDLVVLGAQPRSALHSYVWGDTTEYVLRHAPVPVLVVKD